MVNNEKNCQQYNQKSFYWNQQRKRDMGNLKKHDTEIKGMRRTWKKLRGSNRQGLVWVYVPTEGEIVEREVYALLSPRMSP